MGFQSGISWWCIVDMIIRYIMIMDIVMKYWMGIHDEHIFGAYIYKYYIYIYNMGFYDDV